MCLIMTERKVLSCRLISDCLGSLLYLCVVVCFFYITFKKWGGVLCLPATLSLTEVFWILHFGQRKHFSLQLLFTFTHFCLLRSFNNLKFLNLTSKCYWECRNRKNRKLLGRSVWVSSVACSQLSKYPLTLTSFFIKKICEGSKLCYR